MNIVEQAKKIHKMTVKAAQSLSDEQAVESVLLFDKWENFIGSNVDIKQRVQYDGSLYECVQAHIPQNNWQPTATPALWKKVSIEEFPEWIQPTGGHDAYQIGDKVTYNSKKWVSTADGNVWQPSVYGWEEIL